MTNTETLLTLFLCRKTKVPYTFKKSSALKASCITQIRCHLQFRRRKPCKSCCINKRSAQSVPDIHMILTTCIKLMYTENKTLTKIAASYAKLKDCH